MEYAFPEAPQTTELIKVSLYAAVKSSLNSGFSVLSAR